MPCAIHEVDVSLAKFLEETAFPTRLSLLGSYSKVLSVSQRGDSLIFLVVEDPAVGDLYQVRLKAWESLTDEQRAEKEKRHESKPAPPGARFGVAHVGEPIPDEDNEKHQTFGGEIIDRFLGQVGDLVFVTTKSPFSCLFGSMF